MENNIDDGGLDFLQIPENENSRSFHGKMTSQRDLINTTFWVCDYLENIPTRYSKQKGTAGQVLVSIKPEKDSPKADMKKFFTGSSDVIYILKEIKKRNAFPRRVTLRSSGTRFYFE